MVRKHIVKAFDEELNLLKLKIIEMGEKVEGQLNQALKALIKRDVKLAHEVIIRDTQVNLIRDDVDKFTVNLLVKRQPLALDLRNIISGLKISADLERIADNAARIAKQVNELNNISLEKPIELIIRMAELAHCMLLDVIAAYKESDARKALEVWYRDKEIDKIYTQLLTQLQVLMTQGPENINTYTCLIFVARSCERIGDHITNVAEDVYYIVTGETYHGIPE
jgi:phosphate transport system protein